MEYALVFDHKEKHAVSEILTPMSYTKANVLLDLKDPVHERVCAQLDRGLDVYLVQARTYTVRSFVMLRRCLVKGTRLFIDDQVPEFYVALLKEHFEVCDLEGGSK